MPSPIAVLSIVVLITTFNILMFGGNTPSLDTELAGTAEDETGTDLGICEPGLLYITLVVPLACGIGFVVGGTVGFITGDIGNGIDGFFTALNSFFSFLTNAIPLFFKYMVFEIPGLPSIIQWPLATIMIGSVVWSIASLIRGVGT